MGDRDQMATEILDVAACLRLLRTTSLGRIGFNVDGRPLILPVNYVVDRGTVLFRSSESRP